LHFLCTQATIIQALQQNSELQIFGMHLTSCFHGTVAKQFLASCRETNWHILKDNLSFPLFGNCVDDTTNIIVAVHQSACLVKPTSHNQKLVYFWELVTQQNKFRN
jgi:hypothetical protein